jgi:hypothetical protein
MSIEKGTHTDLMLDSQAIEKPTMDQIDLISSLLLHKEYAKEDEMK